MKRNPHLVPLSRDHHTALLFCWKTRRGLQLGITTERLVAYADYFFEQHLSPHFDDEENFLFYDKTNPLVIHAMQDHQIIRQIMSGNKSKEDIIVLVQTLDDHIRFEERMLFPHLENTMDSEVLEQAGKCIAKGDTQPDNYPDEYWTGTI